MMDDLLVIERRTPVPIEDAPLARLGGITYRVEIVSREELRSLDSRARACKRHALRNQVKETFRRRWFAGEFAPRARKRAALDYYQQLLPASQAEFKSKEAALQTLYRALTPRQKNT